MMPETGGQRTKGRKQKIVCRLAHANKFFGAAATKPLPSVACHLIDESGSTLIVSMIILIILMLLGVTAINASGTQFKLAANLHFENMAMNNAEASAKAAERLLETLPSTANAPAASAVALLADPLTVTWTDANSTQIVAGDDTQRYMIGYVTTNASPLAGVGLDCTDPGNEKNYDCVNTYLITSRGQGQRGAAKFVQTYYAVPLR